MNDIGTSQGNREREKKTSLPSLKTLLAISMVIIPAMVLVSTMSGAVRAEDSKGANVAMTDLKGMVLIPGGTFVMGNEGSYADELPRHKVEMSSFYLDAHEVTNAQFAEFATTTGFVTRAERDGHCWAYFSGETAWQYAAGTDWRHPQGPTSSIKDKMNHPVVCVSWDDAVAYAEWDGKRLPTEAEWEYAARAGFSGHFIANTGSNNSDHSHHLAHALSSAGSDQSPSSKSHTGGAHHAASGSEATESIGEANVWEGHWPEHNEMSDGHYYTAPVESFAPNAWEVYDVLGNVWEWTADWYDSTYYAVSPASDPIGPAAGQNRVARGGSWFCSPNYCGAYSTHYRGASPPDHAFNNVGFRCAKDILDDK
jgi:formylglycine-generating enzyme required for sulfatase activity